MLVASLVGYKTKIAFTIYLWQPALGLAVWIVYFNVYFVSDFRNSVSTAMESPHRMHGLAWLYMENESAIST